MSLTAEPAALSQREPARPDETGCPRTSRFVCWAIIAASAGVSLAAICNVEPLLSANDRSRWCTVWSLAERGTYQIDAIIGRRGWDTIDKVRHEGHFYSSKPPLLPTLVAGVYWLVKQFTGWNLLTDTAAVTRLILVVVNLVPMVIALAVLARFLERYAASNRTRYFVLTTAAFGTFLSTFLVTFNNHTVAAVCVMCTLYPAARILLDAHRGAGSFAASGFLAAFACANELPAALFGLLLFLQLVRQAPRRTLFVFVPAAIVPLAAYFATTALQTGGWQPFYASFGTETYNYEVDGVPSYWSNPTGIDAGGDHPLTYLFNCTMGHHGILSLSPVFLLSLCGWAQLRRWKTAPLRPFLWLGLLLTVVTLGFYLTRTQNYNYGGFTSGLRWMFWLIPFWLVAIIPALDRVPAESRWRGVFIAALLLASTFSAWYPIQNPWRHPWIFQIGEAMGWIDYSTPPPVLDPPATTWFRTLPAPDETAWVEFTASETDGSSTRMRLESVRPANLDDKAVRGFTVRRNRGAPDERVETYNVDAASFEAGKVASEFLRWPGGPPNAAEASKARAFVSGLPQPRAYRAFRYEYLKTPLRPDAFRCLRASAHVDQRPVGDEPALRYWSEVWYCDEVPFGVLKVVTTVFDLRTGAMISRRQWDAAAASGLLQPSG